jgi:SAM-dependent methyltransferase
MMISATAQSKGNRPSNTALREVLDILRCPVCHSGATTELRTNGSAIGSLVCQKCKSAFPLQNSFLDLCPELEEKITPIQHLLQFPPAILVYDNLWRPLGYRMTSGRSFPDDLDRITTLMQPERHRLVLDLACGPGNFTRSIANCGDDIKVVGFDLSRQMLERAVKLTEEQNLSNVCYMRGSALDLPFDPESFDAVICCAALHLFTDYDQALVEISRVLRVGGEFVCQTIIGPDEVPLWLRMAERVVKFGYFQLDDFKRQLSDLRLRVLEEESSKVSYIFRAVKS